MKFVIANLLIVLSICIMLIYGMKRNNNFINISNIIKDHFEIFGGAKKHIIIIYIIPVITCIGISLIYTFSSSMIEIIMVVTSVVISALLAFQGVIMNLERKSEDEINRKILLETNSSINFIVLINICLIFIMLIYMVLKNQIIKSIFTGIILYVLMITFLTILIIVKRIRILLNTNL